MVSKKYLNKSYEVVARWNRLPPGMGFEAPSLFMYLRTFSRLKMLGGQMVDKRELYVANPIKDSNSAVGKRIEGFIKNGIVVGKPSEENIVYVSFTPNGEKKFISLFNHSGKKIDLNYEEEIQKLLTDPDHYPPLPPEKKSVETAVVLTTREQKLPTVLQLAEELGSKYPFNLLMDALDVLRARLK